MIASDHLFRLIKSLSVYEKGYIKKMAQPIPGKEKNYLTLFEAIDTQQEYDERKLKEDLKKKKFIDHLAFDKVYLTSLILKHLRAYHEGSTVNMKLREMLHNAEILFEKAEPELCLRQLSKAKKMALMYERFQTILEVYQWEKTARIYFGKDESLLSIIKEETNITEHLLILKKLETIYQETYFFLRHSMDLRGRKELSRLKKDIFTNPLLKNERIPRGYLAGYWYYGIYSNYYSFVRDHNKHYEYCKKHILHIESYPLLIGENPNQYLAMFSNYLIACLKVGHFEEHKAGISKLEAFGKRKNITEQIKILIFQMIFMNDSDRCIVTGEFERIMKILPEISRGLIEYDSKLIENNRLTLYYNISLCLFGCGQYKNALQWINKIINDSSSLSRTDVHSYARILKLIIHYEMNDQQYLESAIKSTYRYLIKRQSFYKTEKLILHFMRNKISKIVTHADQIKAFSELRKEIVKAWRNPDEEQVRENFDFVSWLESKIENRAFADCVRRRAASSVKAEVVKEKAKRK